MRSIRRSSSAAMKKIAVSFASSDGWMPRPPSENQRRALLTAGLKSTATSSSDTNPSEVQMNAGSRYVR